jgi:hypothetical protein
VAEQARDRIRLLARAWDTDEAGVIDRLLDDYVNATESTSMRGEKEVLVRAHYEGVWIDGVFDADSRRLAITSGHLAGRVFKSPSGAALAIVRSLKPDVHPNHNGWTFWTLASNGQPLETVRQRGGRSGTSQYS